MQAVQEVHGVYGAACVQSSLAVKFVQPLLGTAVVRVARDQCAAVAAALPFAAAVGRRPARLVLRHAAGTLRACQRHVLAHHRAALRGARAAGAPPAVLAALAAADTALPA
jgi:RNase P/RNase MRP subunit POP5